MRIFFLLIILFTFLRFQAQDKVYFLNGTSRVCKVLEISPDELLVEDGNGTATLARGDVLLILFKNGTVETITTPEKSAVYNPSLPKQSTSNNTYYKSNFISLNTLALCNADLSVFYEYITKSKIAGFGFMGAYNFNTRSSLQNLFISMLQNSKKNYDAGVTVNLYPGKFSRRTGFYIGLMTKYTHFSFNVINKTGNGVTYKSANGSQLATLIMTGTHTGFPNNFFIKTMAGIGAFKLNGDYKKEMNTEFYNNSGQINEISFLPKFYFGFNLGLNL